MVDLVTQAARQGKVLAAICHGPWMLCSAKCLKGRKVTGFFAIRDDVENAGGIWQDAACVRDGNIVTSRTPDDLPAFMQGIFAALRGAPGELRHTPILIAAGRDSGPPRRGSLGERSSSSLFRGFFPACRPGKRR